MWFCINFLLTACVLAEVTETVELYPLLPFRGMWFCINFLFTACVLHALRIRTGVGRQDELCSKQLLEDELEHNWHYAVKWKKSDQTKKLCKWGYVRSGHRVTHKSKGIKTRAKTHLKRKQHTSFLQLITPRSTTKCSRYVLSVLSFSCSYVEL